MSDGRETVTESKPSLDEIIDLGHFCREVLAQGANACLPCNLDREWLFSMVQECDVAAERGRPPVATLLAVMMIILDRQAFGAEIHGIEGIEQWLGRYYSELASEALVHLTELTYDPATLETICQRDLTTRWRGGFFGAQENPEAQVTTKGEGS